MNWQQHETPLESGMPCHGWVRDCEKCFVDKAKGYCVFIRTIETSIGKVNHMAIDYIPPKKPWLANSKTGKRDIPWKIKQQIKNELFGPGRVAVEVFPTEEELVDSADIYHLWVLPAGFVMPFTI